MICIFVPNEEDAYQRALLSISQLVMEGPTELLPLIELVSSHVGHLQQHGACQVAVLQQLQVDVHVEGDLSLLLYLLLLQVPLTHPLKERLRFDGETFPCLQVTE